MSVMEPVRKDHPMKLAWDEYQATPEYENTLKWCAHEQHASGSLWASFVDGWERAKRRSTTRAEEALRDISERLEHCGGGADELNKQLYFLIDRYWKDLEVSNRRPKIIQPKLVDGMPRRCRTDLYSPAEKAIAAAIAEVEKLPGHLLETEAVMLLGKAQNLVADLIELDDNP